MAAKKRADVEARRALRLQRICAALDVEPDVAALLVELTDRIAELERTLTRLTRPFGD